MHIWEWVFGWFPTGGIIIFDRTGMVSNTLADRPVVKTYADRPVARTLQRRG